MKTIPVLLAFILAGCATPNATAPWHDTAAPLHWFSNPIPLDASGKMGEPSITIAANGTTWVAAMGEGDRRGDHLWRSDPTGHTFHYLGQPDPAVGGGDVDVAVDSTGRLWLVSLSTITTCVNLGTSTDGKTFIFDPTFCALSNGDRPWVTAGSDGYAYVTYAEGSGPFGLQVVAFNAAHGVPLRKAQLLSGHDHGPSAGVGNHQDRIGKPRLDSHGFLLVPTVDDAGNVQVYRVSHGQTATNSSPVLSTDTLTVQGNHVVAASQVDWHPSTPSLALDDHGGLFVTWMATHNGTRGAYLAASTDGATWTPPLRVSGDLTNVAFPQIVASGRGHVGIAYYGTMQPSGDPDTMVGDWSVVYAYASDALADVPVFSQRFATGVVHHGAICDQGSLCPAGTRALYDFLSLAVAPSGGARIAYTSSLQSDPGIHVVTQDTGPTL